MADNIDPFANLTVACMIQAYHDLRSQKVLRALDALAFILDDVILWVAALGLDIEPEMIWWPVANRPAFPRNGSEKVRLNRETRRQQLTAAVLAVLQEDPMNASQVGAQVRGHGVGGAPIIIAEILKELAAQGVIFAQPGRKAGRVVLYSLAARKDGEGESIGIGRRDIGFSYPEYEPTRAQAVYPGVTPAAARNDPVSSSRSIQEGPGCGELPSFGERSREKVADPVRQGR